MHSLRMPQVSGLIKSVFGLSSAVLSVLFSGLFGAEHVDKFLLLLSVGVPALGLVSSVPLNVVPTKHLSYAVERAQGVRKKRRSVDGPRAAVVLSIDGFVIQLSSRIFAMRYSGGLILRDEWMFSS